LFELQDVSFSSEANRIRENEQRLKLELRWTADKMNYYDVYPIITGFAR